MSSRTYGFNREGLRARLSAILLGIIAISVMAVGSSTVTSFDRAIEPELDNRAQLIGSIIRSDLQHTLELGIPFEKIVGLDDYLKKSIEKFDEIARISVSNASGINLANARRHMQPSVFHQTPFGEIFSLPGNQFELPILDKNRVVGRITIEINPLFVQARLRGMLLDVMVIALVSILIALELALAIAVASVEKPLNRVRTLLDEQRNNHFLHRVRPGGLGGIARAAARLNDRATDLAQRMTDLPTSVRTRISGDTASAIATQQPVRLRLSDIQDIRLPLFLFSAATEVSASFLPLYARDASRPDGLSPELAAAAPLVAYLVCVSVMSPFGGRLTRRFGARNLFLASVIPTALALVAMAVSENLLTISIWRGVMALFYAVATIACQEYGVRASIEERGCKPIGAFVAVVFGGVFCGSAMGGVIAGRYGFEAAFASGAAMAIVAGYLGVISMRGRAGDRDSRPATSKTLDVTTSFSGYRSWLLLLGIAAPMSASTAVFIWYITPLLLSELGAGPADIARTVMLYYLAAIVVGPVASKLSDEHTGPLWLVLSGALVSGLALLSLGLWSGFLAIVVAVAALGSGHAIMRAPLYSLAIETGGERHSMFSALRLVERVGAIVGLVSCALVLGRSGADDSINALGIIVLTGGTLYAAMETWQRIKER